MKNFKHKTTLHGNAIASVLDVTIELVYISNTLIK